jgi:DeoR family transcriptional regulator, suf operon transcriptional repressor
MPTTTELFGPGLGEAQRSVLLALKTRGAATLADLGRELDYAPATLREHLQSLVARRLVSRRARRRAGPGRPQVEYALAPDGEALFPRREGEVLRELVRFLLDEGQRDLLVRFFAARIAARRGAAHARVAKRPAAERLGEVARILSEDGYMARVVPADDGRSTLRLAHCPIKDVVAVTDLPCRAEETFVAELLGTKLARIEYMPNGCSACTYARPARAARPSRTPEA